MQCATDEHRQDLHNGLLQSAFWNTAFDAGLVSFIDGGTPLASTQIAAAATLQTGAASLVWPRHIGMTWEWHRSCDES
jgi:hypothetical protein